MDVVERLLERRTHDEIYSLERHATTAKDTHQRMAALEASMMDHHQKSKAAGDDDKTKTMMRRIAVEVFEEHEAKSYSMVGEAKMNALEERVSAVEEGLCEKATTSHVNRGFEELWDELVTKANALSVERELNAMTARWESAAAARDKNVEDDINGIWEETKVGLAASRDAASKNASWLARLEASQRDLVHLAESQAERIKSMNLNRDERFEGLRGELNLMRSFAK